MRLPVALRKPDDRVLGDRSGPEGAAEPRAVETRPDREAPPRRRRSASAGLRRVLSVVYRVTRLVFLLLALVMLVGIGFTLAPTNPDNDVVSGVLDLAERAAGPFKDVFTQDDPERQTVVNYGFAAVIYLLAATLVRKLPLPGGKS
jgi:hypothetical protein